MTLTSPTNRADFVGNGSTTAFPFPFKIFAASDLLVVTRNPVTGVETTHTLTTHYTVSGAGSPNGGTVTFLTPPADGDVVTLYRRVAITQPASFQNQGSFHPRSHEDAFDRLTMIAQQHDDAIGRSLRLPITVDPTEVTPELPAPVGGELVGWNDEGTGLIGRPISEVGGTQLVETTAERDALPLVDDLRIYNKETQQTERYVEADDEWVVDHDPPRHVHVAEVHGVRAGDTAGVAVPLQAVLQHALDFNLPLAGNGFVPVRTVELPPGDLWLERPVLLARDGVYSGRVHMKGEGQFGTMFKSTADWHGPMFATTTEAASERPEYGPSLYAGGTQSLRLTHDDFPLVCLHDTRATRLHGLGAFTIEFRTKLRPNTNDVRYNWMAAHGRRFVEDNNAKRSLRIWYDAVGDDVTAAEVNIGGSMRKVKFADGQLAEGTIYDLAIDYDGSHLRSYLDGVMVEKVACTGTIQQEAVEDFIIGIETKRIFEQGINDHVGNVDIENIRISTVARYGSDLGYAPSTTLHAWDASTKFLLTLEETEGPFLVARVSGNEKFWMVYRDQRLVGTMVGGIDFSDFSMHGGQKNMWFNMQRTTLCRFSRIYCTYGGGRGWLRTNNCLLNVTEECYFLGLGAGEAEALLCQVNACGAGISFRNTFEGGIYQQVSCVASNDIFLYPWFAPSIDTVCSFWHNSDGAASGGGDGDHLVIYLPHLDQENEGGNWLAGMIHVEGGMVTYFGAEIEGQTQPAIIIDGWRKFKVHDSRMNSHGTHVIGIKSGGLERAVFDGMIQRHNTGGGYTPWVEAGKEQWVEVRALGHVSMAPWVLDPDSATPYVRGSNYWTVGASATAITDFLDTEDQVATPLEAMEGWTLELHFTGARTVTHDTSKIRLVGGADFVGSADDTLVLRHRDGVWREISRSVL